IYLCSPYSHSDPTVREQRYQAACAMTARMMLEGQVVYSPVVHGHPLTRLGLPIDWFFWQYFDLRHLEYCNEILVLMLDGWTESAGVRAEIEIATEFGKPVWYRAPLGPYPPTLASVRGEGVA
ncbi:MAG: DUF1937 family protein, partial [Planctomycetaceae bacterium]|nr:DUF1937 family protein [Planctomycetaceae bacterium]